MSFNYSTELFDTLDSVQDQYQNSTITTESYNPTIMYYSNNQEQLAYYLYQQQRSNNHILDADTMLYPIQCMPYPSFTEEQQCRNIVYNTSPIQHPMLQASVSPISYNESPLSIKSDNFTMPQQPNASFYTYDPAMDMNLMTPPTTLHDSNLMSPPAAVQDLLSAAVYEQPVPSNIQQRRSSISSLSSLSSISSKSTAKYLVTKSKQNNTVLFHCEYEGCTKTFTRTYNLKSHRRTHTDEKPFACHMCPKAFARQHDRNRHEKLHLGLRPYPCEYCSKSFARLDALNRHLKRDKRNSSKESPPPCLLLKLKKKHLASSKKKKLV